MSDGEDLAEVVDLAKVRARRGAQLLRGQARRVNPKARLPRAVWQVDWDSEKALDPAVLAGKQPPPVKVKKVRRSGVVRKPNPKGPWARQARRIAWKVERREAAREKVAWRGSRAARCEIAPVIPLSHRGMAARFRVPLAAGAVTGDLLDGDAA
jgi:hypothetical protein